MTIYPGGKGGLANMGCCKRLSYKNEIYDVWGSQLWWTTRSTSCWKLVIRVKTMLP